MTRTASPASETRRHESRGRRRGHVAERRCPSSSAQRRDTTKTASSSRAPGACPLCPGSPRSRVALRQHPRSLSPPPPRASGRDRRTSLSCPAHVCRGRAGRAVTRPGPLPRAGYRSCLPMTSFGPFRCLWPMPVPVPVPVPVLVEASHCCREVSRGLPGASAPLSDGHGRASAEILPFRTIDICKVPAAARSMTTSQATSTTPSSLWPRSAGWPTCRSTSTPSRTRHTGHSPA